jgi:NTF2-like protein (DUF6841)
LFRFQPQGAAKTEFVICDQPIAIITMNTSRRSFTELIAVSLISSISCRATSTREGSINMDEDKIRQLLERLGQAVSSGDLKGVSSCWEIPALFLSDEGATAFANSGEIEKVMAQAAEHYRSQGIASTKPELERVDTLSNKLAVVDVRWPSFDASGKEKSSERSHYIVQFRKDGQARIRIALTRTK